MCKGLKNCQKTALTALDAPYPPDYNTHIRRRPVVEPTLRSRRGTQSISWEKTRSSWPAGTGNGPGVVARVFRFFLRPLFTRR